MYTIKVDNYDTIQVKKEKIKNFYKNQNVYENCKIYKDMIYFQQTGDGVAWQQDMNEPSNSEQEKIEHLFAKSRTGRQRNWNNRTMLNAMLWIARSEASQKDLPNRYPPYQNTYSLAAFTNGEMMTL